MLAPEPQIAYEPKSYYYYGGTGSIDDSGGTQQPTQRKYTIVQSFWTKPVKTADGLRKSLFIAALSLAYAHRSGYKVHMHTDSKGYELLKGFGYDKLAKTLDTIPDTVPTELFAVGKFFALRAEGTLGKIHTDFDVFIKRAGLLDRFFKDNRIDVIVQNEEDYRIYCFHENKIRPMHILGYPATTRPTWQGSLNTGVIGFNNPVLAAKYMNNYFEALEMYTVEKFEQYKKYDDKGELDFDFILEQVNLSYMSIGYNVLTLIPTHNPDPVSVAIGYTHLFGGRKWSDEYQEEIKRVLQKINARLYSASLAAARKVKD